MNAIGLFSILQGKFKEELFNFAIIIFFAMLLAVASSANAQSILSGDYIPAPPGTNLFVTYYVHENLNDNNIKGVGTLQSNTHLNLDVSVSRYVRYFNVGSYTGLFEVVQSFGGLWNAEVNGTHLPGTFGAGDTTVAGVIWPVNDPVSETYVGVGGFLNIPSGSYNKNSALNLGTNIFSGSVQVAGNKGFGKYFSIDWAGAIQIYGDNTSAALTGGTIRTNPTYSLQTFLNYNPSAGTTIGVGFAGLYGGNETLNRTRNGFKVGPEYERIRLDASKFITPTIQLLGEVSHDLNAVGGFRNQFEATIRLAKVF